MGEWLSSRCWKHVGNPQEAAVPGGDVLSLHACRLHTHKALETVPKEALAGVSLACPRSPKVLTGPSRAEKSWETW